MTTLNDLFRGSIDPPTHPRLRNWGDRLAREGTSATVEITGSEAVLGQSQPEMHIQFTEDGRLSPLETVAWDPELNSGLIKLGVRAPDPDHEAERFALGLRAAMQRPVRRFGDGYFNSVLVDLIRESDLTQYPAIAQVLSQIHTNSPSRDGKGQAGYELCRGMIAYAIGDGARELTGPLRYSEEEAKPIITDALARYLDQRFSVSNRRRLGLL